MDGVDLRHSTHERAVEVIQAAGNPVNLLVQSLVNLVRISVTIRNIDVSALHGLFARLNLSVDFSAVIKVSQTLLLLSPEKDFYPLLMSSTFFVTFDKCELYYNDEM